MITHSLIQGSDAWHQFRLEHFGASEAAPMLGLSSKVKRTELLHMKHTGNPKEFSDWVQKNVLDRGHEVEAMARPIIEEIFGIDLYPVTCSDGYLSASCDGLTLCGVIAFEHKQWNKALASAVGSGELPDEYMPQCQQILMVTGAEKVIFTVSDGTKEKMAWVEIEPEPEWFERIRAGWDQFRKDLAEYVPFDVSEKQESEAIMQLPALSIQTSGSISIISNLDVFGKKLEEFIGDLDFKPNDDQGFANAEAAVKVLQKAQDALEAAESSALAQASSVDEMRRLVALYADTARKARLMLEKMVKTRKEQIKGEIISAGKSAFFVYLDVLENEIGPCGLRNNVKEPDWIGAAKNKRTLSSLHDAVNTALANGKIEADAVARHVRQNLSWFRGTHLEHEFLFADLRNIIYKQADDFRLFVQSRIEKHQDSERARKEIERELIREEEEKKAREALMPKQLQPVPSEMKDMFRNSPSAQPSGFKKAVIRQAREQARLFRSAFCDVKELAGVIREIDLFLATMEETA